MMKSKPKDAKSLTVVREWTDYKKSELLKLPNREWRSDRVYDYLLIVPTRLKHDSGFSCIAIIGCIGDKPIEICAYPDDLELPDVPPRYGSGELRIDCSYPSGILRLWSRRYKFQVPTALSSTEIVAVSRDADIKGTDLAVADNQSQVEPLKSAKKSAPKSTNDKEEK